MSCIGFLVIMALSGVGCRKSATVGFGAAVIGKNADPSPTGSRHLLDDGHRLLLAGRFVEACEIFQKLAAGSKQDRGLAAIGIAVISFQQVDYDQTARIAALVVDCGGGVTARLLLADAHFPLDRYRDAAKDYGDSLKIDANNPSVRNGLTLATKRM